jgi:hypothetical protein
VCGPRIPVRLAIDADRLRLPVGEELARHVADVARSVFPQALVTAKPSGTARAVLYPRLVAVERTLPHFGSGDAIPLHRTSIVLEWRLEDPARRLVWVETVTASSEQAETDGAQPRRAMLKRLFEQLYADSQRQLDGSRELRAYAERAAAPAAASKTAPGG